MSLIKIKITSWQFFSFAFFCRFILELKLNARKTENKNETEQTKWTKWNDKHFEWKREEKNEQRKIVVDNSDRDDGGRERNENRKETRNEHIIVVIHTSLSTCGQTRLGDKTKEQKVRAMNTLGNSKHIQKMLFSRSRPFKFDDTRNAVLPFSSNAKHDEFLLFIFFFCRVFRRNKRNATRETNNSRVQKKKKCWKKLNRKSSTHTKTATKQQNMCALSFRLSFWFCWSHSMRPFHAHCDYVRCRQTENESKATEQLEPKQKTSSDDNFEKTIE